jgi:hypothetical protein
MVSIAVRRVKDQAAQLNSIATVVTKPVRETSKTRARREKAQKAQHRRPLNPDPGGNGFAFSCLFVA